MKKKVAFLLCCLLNLNATSVSADANEAGKAFAQSMNDSKLKNMASQVDPNTVPGYQGTNVKETQYFNEGLNIENIAQEKAATDPTAQFINEGRQTRPTFNLDPRTDPLFKRQDEIGEKAHLLSDTYTGCVELPVGEEDKTITGYQYCNVTGKQDLETFECQNKLITSCTGTPKVRADSITISANKSQPHRIIDFDGGVKFISPSNGVDYCGYQTVTATFDAGPTTAELNFSITVNNQPLVGAVLINGIRIHSRYQLGDILINDDHDYGWSAAHCLNSGNFSGFAVNKNYNINHLIRPGSNIISIISYGGGGKAITELTLHDSRTCTESSQNSFTCPAGKSHLGGTLVDRVCTEGPQTRIINGYSVYKDCWAWTDRYSKPGNPYFVKDALCSQIEAQGCGQIQATCQTTNGQFCTSELLTYSCSSTTAARTVNLCGAQLVCPDGGCTSDIGQSYEPATDDFKQAAASLAVAGEIADNFDTETLNVFSGKGLECQNKNMGMSNCCKDSGWLSGLTSCDSEEKELGLAKEAGQTRYIGSYDRGTWPDKREYKAYCAYPSKLSRIIIEQGRNQLGLGFGSAKSPNCSGLTIQQLEMVNFDRLDLSEFYSDVMAKAGNGPNTDNLANDLKNKLMLKFPQSGGQ